MDSPAPNQPPGSQTPEENSLSPDDIKNLTDQLSREIDQEIKKQFADTHGLDTQQKVNQVLKQVQEAKPNPEQTDTVIKPEIPPAKAEIKPSLTPPQNLSPENFVEASLDPLQASIQAAFATLAENDKIGEWTLKKIYSTSFGANKSSFYELENQAGAKWTLNPEEVKELLKANISTSPAEPKILSPEPATTAKIGGLPEKKALEKEPEVEKKIETEKPKPEVKPEPKIETKPDVSGPDLSKEQIAFLTKLHAEPKLWSLFISLKPEQVQKVQEQYEKGTLDQIGIDAHPLFDKLAEEDFGKEVVVKKGENITSLLSNAGFQLSFQSSDSLILGSHILANEDTLKQTVEKVKNSGIATPDFPTKSQAIKLIKDGLGGNNQAYQTLITILTFLPAEAKFRILTPDQIESLSKYF